MSVNLQQQSQKQREVHIYAAFRILKTILKVIYNMDLHRMGIKQQFHACWKISRWNCKEDKGGAVLLGAAMPVDPVMKDISLTFLMSFKTFYFRSFLRKKKKIINRLCEVFIHHFDSTKHRFFLVKNKPHIRCLKFSCHK